MDGLEDESYRQYLLLLLHYDDPIRTIDYVYCSYHFTMIRKEPSITHYGIMNEWQCQINNSATKLEQRPVKER